MATADKFLPAAQAFKKAYPIGTQVTAGDIRDFARRYKNGLDSDLLIADEGKMIGSLCRHINLGAQHADITEQYHIDKVSPGKYEVVKLADHVNRQASVAVFKSTNAAMKPLDSNRKAIDALNVADLDADMAAQIEERRKEIDAAATPLRQAAITGLTEVFVLRLMHAGRPEEDARAIVQALPSLTKELKLLNQLRG